MVSEAIRERVRAYIQHQGKKSREAIEALVADSHARLLEVVGALPDDVASRKPAADEWSVRELIRHVIAAERGVAFLVDSLSRGEGPPVTDRAIGMQLDDDGRAFAAYIDDLRDTQARMIETLRGLPQAPDLMTLRPHPFFGELNCLEWAVFQRVHDEDHIQHSRKIVEAVS